MRCIWQAQKADSAEAEGEEAGKGEEGVKGEDKNATVVLTEKVIREVKKTIRAPLTVGGPGFKITGLTADQAKVRRPKSLLKAPPRVSPETPRIV